MLDIIKRGFIEQFPTRPVVQQHSSLLQQVARTAKPSVLVAAMPKSGSTFVSTVFSLVSGYRKAHYVYGWERNAQDLYLPRLVQCMGIPVVVQQHTVATGPNIELIRVFNLRTVVLVRDIFDVVASILDHSTSEDFRGPAGFLTEDYLHFDDETKLDMIIDSILPWYFGFFVSWKEAEANGLPVYWLRYGEAIAGDVRPLCDALRFCEVTAGAEDVQDAIVAAKAEPQKIRFNKGINGRGRPLLNEHQRQRIESLARYYPSVDFTLLGLDSHPCRAAG